MKLYVACAVCSVRRVHGAGYRRAEHMCSRGEPLGLRGLFFFNAQGDVMAARVGRNPAGGSKSLPDGAVHEGRGTRQLHDITGKVQSAGPCIAVQMHDVRVAALGCALKKHKNNELIREEKQASLSGEQDSLGRGERPPVWGTG